MTAALRGVLRPRRLGSAHMRTKYIYTMVGSDFDLKRSSAHPSILKIVHPAEKLSHEERCVQLQNQRTRLRPSCYTNPTHRAPTRGNPAVSAAKLLYVLARVTLSVAFSVYLLRLAAAWLCCL